MNHVHARDLIAGYVLGALETGDQQGFLDHIRSCVPCLALTEEYLAVGTNLAENIKEVEAPASLRIRTMETFAQKPAHRMRPVAEENYRLLSGLGWPRVRGASKNLRKRWTTK